MNVKTSASLLREFCAQQKVAPPHFDTVKDATGVFITLGKAFNLSAQGCGRTKKDSMHAASQQLIGKYKVQFTDSCLKRMNDLAKR